MSLKDAAPMIRREYLKLEKLVSARGQRKLRIMREDIIDAILGIPVPDGRYKTVCAFGCLNFTKHIEQTALEIRRILGSGGKLAIAVWTKQGRDYKDGVFYFANKAFVNAFAWARIEKYEIIYSDKDRQLIGLIGVKP